MNRLGTTPRAGTKPVVCRICGEQLGECTDTRLYIGSVVLVRSVLLVCLNCGNRQGWRPSAVKT